MNLIFLSPLLLMSAAFWGVQGTPAFAAEAVPKQAIQPGEQLTYDISWLYITAGTAVMAISDAGTDGDRPLVKLLTTAQSKPAITKFFPVDNRVESIMDPATLLPEH